MFHEHVLPHTVTAHTHTAASNVSVLHRKSDTNTPPTITTTYNDTTMKIPLLVYGMLVLLSAAVSTLGATVSVNDLDDYLEEKSKEKESQALMLGVSGINEDITIRRKERGETVLSPLLPRLTVLKAIISTAELDATTSSEEADDNHSTTVADDGSPSDGKTEGKQAPNVHGEEG